MKQPEKKPFKRQQLLFLFSLLPVFLLPTTSVANNPNSSTISKASPNNQAQRNQAEDLTLELLNLAGKPHEAESETKALITARNQLILEILKTDPAAVLQLGLTEHEYDNLPAKLQRHFEREIEIEGILSVFYEDYLNKSQSQYVYTVESDKGTQISLHFTNPSLGFQSGKNVKVKGLFFPGIQGAPSEKTEGAMVLANGKKQIEFLDAPGTGGSKGGGKKNDDTGSSGPEKAIGEHKTLVILVTPEDEPIEPYTVSYAHDTMFGTTNDYFMENSFQQMWLSGDVAGWFPIPTSPDACDTSAIETEAKAAASAAGYNLNNYDHYVFAFPLNSSCGFWGRSSVGGNPSRAWISGDFELGVTAHELGHSFGLSHSHSKDCGLDSIGENCTHLEYGDVTDIMGSSSFAHINPFQKELLGWLNYNDSPAITTITTDGTYTLDSYIANSAGSKAFKIAKSIDSSTGEQIWYYIHARQAAGFDNGFLSTNLNALDGVLIHTGTDTNSNSSFLLDMTPESADTNYWDRRDPALEVGQTFEDAEATLSITTEWADANGAAITVSFGGSSEPGPTALSVDTDQSSYSLNQRVTITANATSGGAPSANSIITFRVTKTDGTNLTSTATSDSNGNAEFKFRLKRQDPLGIYTTTVEINGGANNASTNFMVN